jgi:hypothetical protein
MVKSLLNMADSSSAPIVIAQRTTVQCEFHLGSMIGQFGTVWICASK